MALSSLAVNLTSAGPKELDAETARRATAVAEEAFEVGTLIDDSTSVDIARHLRAQIALRRGEFSAALEAYAELAEVIIARGGRTTIVMPFVVVATCAFAGAGHAETAAVLLGAGDALSASPTRFGPEWVKEWLSELDSALPLQLGTERFAELRSQGAALGPIEAMEYVRVEAERAITHD
jgi:hypothetical protein